MPTRRHFLKVLAATSAVACSSSSGGGQAAATGDIAAGNVSALAVGSLQVIAGQPVVLGRDAGGLYAMSTICTHQQCDMRNDGSITSTGLTCDCHSSVFDAQGQPTSGPASRALPHYAVEIAAGGAITVHAGVAVSVATRVAVPA
jgi:nitrite reductase/ring-hydroxylating ferredoxin subunit